MTSTSNPLPNETSYAELENGDCQSGEKHRVMLGLTGSKHPAWCTTCGAWTDNVPSEVYKDL